MKFKARYTVRQHGAKWANTARLLGTGRGRGMEPEVSLPGASASRSAVRSFRMAVEDALHRLGWLLVDVSSLDAPDAPGAAATLLQGVFAEAARTFALPESDLVELTQQNNERTGCQALSYLPLGSEPLYAEGQAQQVRR